MGATLGSPAGGTNLGDHAAAGYPRAGAAGHGFKAAIIRAPFADQGGGGVETRIGAVEAFLVGKNDQGLGFDQVGYQRTEGVVVAKLDFIGDHGVVLVDDGHHIEVEQGLQGRARIEVARAVRHIVMGQQYLRGFQAVIEESRFIGLCQPHLTDGGGGLQVVHGVRADGPAQTLHAGGNGAGRHQQDLAPFGMQGSDLSSAIRDEIVRQTGPVIGDQCAADLDDNALGASYPLSHWHAFAPDDP